MVAEEEAVRTLQRRKEMEESHFMDLLLHLLLSGLTDGGGSGGTAASDSNL